MTPNPMPRVTTTSTGARDGSSANTIVIAEGVWGPEFEALARRRDVVRLGRTATAADLDGARVLVVRNRTQVTRELVEGAPELIAVARAGSGLDNIDIAAADDNGVVVIGAAGMNAVSVAEHALGLALAVARHTVALDRSTRAGGWDRTPGGELSGGVWGLLSVGATGLATGRLAHALGMTVLGYDPYRDPNDPALASAGIELITLAEVVGRADVLSVHLPHTPETTGLVDAGMLAQARRGLILINVGRGEVVDEMAVADALRSGRLGGAGLDVRIHEPPGAGAGEAALESLPNVILTPHIAGITAASQRRIITTLCEGIDAVLAGRPARSAVTRIQIPTRGLPA